jgi:hypothetical protein
MEEQENDEQEREVSLLKGHGIIWYTIWTHNKNLEKVHGCRR